MPWKIVKIIDEYRVVVNAGKSNQITRESELMVYMPGNEVFDPDTNESLGILDTVKCYLDVIHVFDKMCICVNAKTKASNILNFTSFLQPLSNRHLPIPINAEDITGGLQQEKNVKIGDLVRLA